MKIIQKIKDSIYNPDFYQREKDGSVKSALSYFVKLTLIEALCVTLVFSILFIPLISKLLSSTTTSKVVEAFPKDLTVTLKGGLLSTNVTEPYIVPFSKATRENPPLAENALIIDTKSPLNLDLINTNKTSVLITKDSIVVKDSKGKITIQPLKNFPDIQLSKTKIEGWINSAQPYFKFVAPVFLTLAFICIFFVSIVTSLIMILLLSFVIWIVLKIQKRPLLYKQIYKLGFYCITSVLLLNILLTIFGTGSIWYLSTILFLVIFFINIKPKTIVVSPDQPSL